MAGLGSNYLVTVTCAFSSLYFLRSSPLLSRNSSRVEENVRVFHQDLIDVRDHILCIYVRDQIRTDSTKDP